MLFVTKPDIFYIPCKLWVCKFPKKNSKCGPSLQRGAIFQNGSPEAPVWLHFFLSVYTPATLLEVQWTCSVYCTRQQVHSTLVWFTTFLPMWESLIKWKKEHHSQICIHCNGWCLYMTEWMRRMNSPKNLLDTNHAKCRLAWPAGHFLHSNIWEWFLIFEKDSKIWGWSLAW